MSTDTATMIFLMVIVAIMSVGVPIGIIASIVHFISRRRKEDQKMFEASLNYQKGVLEHEKEQDIPQRIVLCGFCGQTAQYGTGKCPYCGGKLRKPDVV